MKVFVTISLILCAITLSLSQETGTVIITEIMYNAASSETTTQTQYIEIANTTNGAVSLNNWTIDDEDADGPNTLPNVTLPPFGIAVICGSSAADFQGAFGSGFTVISLSDLSQTMFNMANTPSSTNEVIQLRDDVGTLVDELNYDDSSPWPPSSNGFSIYLNLPNNQMNATSNNDGANWALSADGVAGAFSSSTSGVWNNVEVGSPGNINGDFSLPVALSAFTATAGNNKVVIRWTTESEIENVGFEILRASEEEGNYSLISSYQSNPGLRGQFNSNTKKNYQFVDELVINDLPYWYKLVDVSVSGLRTEHGPISATPRGVGNEITRVGPELPKNFNLFQNFPNPFNPRTTLQFDIPAFAQLPADVSIRIYNALGQKVKTLYAGNLQAGEYRIVWEGDYENGSPAPGGIYFAVLRVNFDKRVVKLILLK